MAKPPLEDSWFSTRAMFDDDDLDTVFRLRTAMPGKRVRAQYPVMMIIKWFYPAKKDGMPKQADLERMAAFEDLLETHVEQPVVGVQVACLTGNGRRSWRYYVADAERFTQVVKPLLAAHAPPTTELKRVDDPQWEGLGELLPLLDCVVGDQS